MASNFSRKCGCEQHGYVGFGLLLLGLVDETAWDDRFFEESDLLPDGSPTLVDLADGVLATKASPSKNSTKQGLSLERCHPFYDQSDLVKWICIQATEYQTELIQLLCDVFHDEADFGIFSMFL